jgi:branched-chain amino acid transport system permease protein
VKASQRLSLTAIVLLRRVIYAPFGYTLRAARDSATRAEAIARAGCR